LDEGGSGLEHTNASVSLDLGLERFFVGVVESDSSPLICDSMPLDALLSVGIAVDKDETRESGVRRSGQREAECREG
jgi:hypothetical protein